MAESAPAQGQSEPMSYDHDQLEKRVAPGFGMVGGDLHEAVKRAADALKALGDLPSGEETDQKFLRWFTPKRDQMLALTDDLADAYGDIGDGLLAMHRGVLVLDWGMADDLTKLPDYLADGPAAKRDGA
ncbi:hypothetical protein [Streptosporangium roseum]|uniref:Uncharacterized protein n=1 Tax=Streptosporangium roseum (strain ATCC 12428 / DSM 43021 / JCM 3005 / KCTC 9067 / NCIMB 10171 / NRRL 2505 / NI 9100) TaxID=479432 RepID=D2AU92_STRRD|nr:hypothetical protein [Streptosporangium roseum]ACZ90547.1 hypothetical protein Sros_7889 [Streptosporangium roseum DSM 43021]